VSTSSWTNCSFSFLVDETPIFVSPISNNISVVEGGQFVVDLMATDFHGNSIDSFFITGVDKDDFSIINDERLILNTPANFETKSSYYINLNVNDEFGNLAILDLSIGVDNGKIYFFKNTLAHNKYLFAKSPKYFKSRVNLANT
jgi:hypothetical protein